MVNYKIEELGLVIIFRFETEYEAKQFDKDDVPSIYKSNFKLLDVVQPSFKDKKNSFVRIAQAKTIL